MMEKYGAEIQKYEVIEITPAYPDNRNVKGTDLTLDEANELVEKDKNYLILPL